MKKYLLASLLAFTLMVNNTTHAEPGDSISKQQAVDIAQQHYPGRVLAVKLQDKVYRIKTLNESGEVRVISIDAETGKILSEK